MDVRKTTSKARRAKWQKLIAEAACSGRSIREFCRQRRVTEAQFYTWRARLNGKVHGMARRRAMSATKAATFALVSDTPGELDAGIELILADGRRVRIRRGVDEQTLRTVLAAVGTGPC
ncbi:MAG: transposase [Planctomycetota bacterium]|nr:transposase [Planctomycetota bacterium]